MLEGRAGAGAGAEPQARRAHVYICGGTRMGADVLHAFEALVARGLEADGAAPGGGGGAAAAAAYVKRMQSERRYVQELWQTS